MWLITGKLGRVPAGAELWPVSGIIIITIEINLMIRIYRGIAANVYRERVNSLSLVLLTASDHYPRPTYARDSGKFCRKFAKSFVFNFGL
jgi:hypothetical protein